jgi:hypothetical protein
MTHHARFAPAVRQCEDCGTVVHDLNVHDCPEAED